MKKDSLSKNTLKIVVLVHLSLWLIYVSVTGYAFSYKQPDTFIFVFTRKMYELFSFTLITVSVYVFLDKALRYIQKNYLKVIFFIIVFAITSVVMELNIILYTYLIGNKIKLTLEMFFLVSSYQFIFLLPFMGFYLTLKYWKESKAEKERAIQLSILAREAQLEMLSYQLNPHFLFNSLNTLKALIEVDKTMAREIIDDLSDYLRTNLDKKNKKSITLEDEFESTRKYLNIQKKRFGDKIKIYTKLDDSVREVFVPPFIIQPLIENAIKYGTETCKDTLEINLEVKKEKDNVLILVKNSGTISKAKKHSCCTGIGLENMRKRLNLYYEDSFSFNLNETEGYVVAEMRLGELKHV